MAEENKTQEFNRAIKELQGMVKDKLFINLAEKFYNLKVEMSNLTRAVKEKESALIYEENKKLIAETQKVQEPAVVSQPKVEEVKKPVQEERPIQHKEFAPRDNNYQQRPYNNGRQFNNQNGGFRQNNPNGNPNYRNNNFNAQQRPFNRQNGANGRPFNNQNGGFRPNGANGNPNFKQGAKPFNKDSKRPAINYAQPIITASPARNFNNKKKDNTHFEEKRQYTKRDLLKRGMLEEENNEDRMLNRK
ncbi:MAG: hypothetical protein MJ152_04965, partial [Clostridia bacterium]|nr:hypothetical protein [Clostridia bacterium]